MGKGIDFYSKIQNGDYDWASSAKEYWNSLYKEYQDYLDVDFSVKFSDDIYARLWELTIVSYLDKINENSFGCSAKIVRFFSKKNLPAPDFCVDLNGNRFYVEVTTSSIGKNSQQYPGLHKKLEELCGSANRVPVDEYRERISSSIREKAVKKYDPSLVGSNSHKGYKDIVKSNGFILALSTAKIPFIHNPRRIEVELSCLFPFHHSPTVIFSQNGADVDEKTAPFHMSENSYKKINNSVSIDNEYFSSKKYSYISAILLSHNEHVFFPDFDKFYNFLNWNDEHKNDFILIHNPNAKVPLPHKTLPVQHEFVADILDDSFNITDISAIQSEG